MFAAFSVGWDKRMIPLRHGYHSTGRLIYLKSSTSGLFEYEALAHLSMVSFPLSSLHHLSSSIRLVGKCRCTAIMWSLQRVHSDSSLGSSFLHCRDNIGLVMSSAWFPPSVTSGIHQKLHSLSHQTWEFCFSSCGSTSRCLGKLQTGCHVPFTKAWLPSGHSTLQVWLVNCYRTFWKVLLSPLKTSEALTEWYSGSSRQPCLKIYL